MAFAIELYFDGVADSRIRSAWSALSAASLPAWPLRIGARPHISILVIDRASPESIDTIFRSMLSTPPFEIVFGSADHFEVDDAIVFLKPDVSSDLHRLNKRAVAEARSCGLIPRHHEEEWIPHCTCDYQVGKPQLSMGLSILKQLLPLQARVQELGYVEVTPESVRQIATAMLGVTQETP
jgi:2'-5' RNA ligase